MLTFDLRLPTWPFFLVAWLGDVSAVLLIAVRTYRLIFQPESMGGAVPDQAGRVSTVHGARPSPIIGFVVAVRR